MRFPNEIQSLSIKINRKRTKIKMFCFINTISKTMRVFSLRPEAELNLFQNGLLFADETSVKIKNRI